MNEAKIKKEKHNILSEQKFNAEVLRQLKRNSVSVITGKQATGEFLSKMRASQNYIRNNVVPNVVAIPTCTEPYTGGLADVYLIEVARPDRNKIDLDQFIRIEHVDSSNEYSEFDFQVHHAAGPNGQRYTAAEMISKSGPNNILLRDNDEQRLAYITNLIAKKKLGKPIF